MLMWIGMLRAPFALLGTGLLAILSTAKATDWPDSEQVSRLLSEAGEQAFQLRSDALMVAYGATHSNVNWARPVKQVKDHIQKARRQVAKLGEQRAFASPGQMVTIDRVQPLLNELVGNSEAVIRYVEEEPNRLRQHKAQIAAHADLSSALTSLIANFVQYGNARQILQSLADELDLSHH